MRFNAKSKTGIVGGGGGGELNAMSSGGGESDVIPTDTGGLSISLLEGDGGVSALAGTGGYCTHSATSTTHYIVSQGKILAEYNHPSTGAPRFNYIYAGDQRIAMRGSLNKLYYYLNDHLGSARVVIDSAGTVADKSYYTSFGRGGPSFGWVPVNPCLCP